MHGSIIQIGIPGGTELMILLMIAILLFGANKIPKLARSSGQAMGEFRKGREQIEQEVAEVKEETVGEVPTDLDPTEDERGSETDERTSEERSTESRSP